ncbi:hypothetical protein [Bacteroides nordii]|uniref:hypothetical protein n=1 Tax=Bacteroides nordii TaxID=291645 RepID=UPI0034A40ABD
MNSLDYIVLSLGISVILCFLLLLVKGKKVTMNKKYRYYPLLLVVLAISSILYLNHYSENQIDTLVDKFNKLLYKENANNYDSLSFTKERKDEIIDSLKKVNAEYYEILQNLKKQEKIAGNKSGIIPNVENAIENIKKEIYEIETYNEIIDESVYAGKMKGYKVSGSNSNFIFQAPKDISGDYLDFVIKFRDEKLLDKIVIYLSVNKVHKDGNSRLLFDEYYKPQKGVNAFRIKNYLKEKDTEVRIGYFMKSEIGKDDFPTYERVVFSVN